MISHKIFFLFVISASLGILFEFQNQAFATVTVPQSPTGLTATATTSSQINLSWTAPTSDGGSAITGYKIDRSTNGGSTWSSLVPNTGSTATTYSNIGLYSNTTYTYRVSANNIIGSSFTSNTASATTKTTVPQHPTGLTVTAVTSSQINLSWAAPISTGGSAITGYKIDRSTNGGSTWSSLVPNTGSTATTYSDTGLIANTTYTYRVFAINSVGTSFASNSAFATTPTAFTVPQPPTGLTATAASSSQIDLSWTVPSSDGGSSITGYMIERSDDGGSTWSSLVPNTGSTATTYSDTGLIASTTYTYRVSANNIIGSSSASNTASATATNPTAPQPPTGLTATAASSSQINLSWTAPTNNGGSVITGYKIDRSTNGGSTWSTISNTGSTATTYSNTGLSSSTTYTYRVSANNIIGTSSPSNTASATTNIPHPPTALAAASSSSQINLSWIAPSNNGGSPITGYKIYRSTTTGTETLLTTLGNVLSYTNIGLTNGVKYFYMVTATNSAGESAKSNEASAIPATIPAAPQNLQTLAGNTQVSLSWIAPSNNGGSPITGYKIYRSTITGTETLLKTIGNVLSYNNTGLKNGVTYFYKVTATNSAGESAKSNEASVIPVTIPSAPQNLLVASSNTYALLFWDAPSNNGGSPITGYKIYRSTITGTETLLTTLGNVLSYNNTGLTNGVKYFYMVTATNSAGESAKSNETSVIPASMPPIPIGFFLPSLPTGLQSVLSSRLTLLDWGINNFRSDVTDKFPTLQRMMIFCSVTTNSTTCTNDSFSQTKTEANGATYKPQYLAYDNEISNADLSTPTIEINSPASYTNQAAILVHSSGYKFCATPTKRMMFAEYKGVNWAKAECATLQFEGSTGYSQMRLLSDVSTLANWIHTNSSGTTKVILQMDPFETTKFPGTIAGAVTSIKTVRSYIQGVNFVCQTGCNSTSVSSLLTQLNR